ncbi:hypothetical protein K435DRAFT_964016 [Dendrothele bispora CBS 962.96]|uniref:Uncharacterized protein n=1 Tax=Dendrothele bispora (strain CBS 962.96) TaxID=1314807 RepID=A0A4S8MD38_DENBC|nr:hypothetical protein K435DRAFT_964016 [Dendrothele bispora CBS 962.96]
MSESSRRGISIGVTRLDSPQQVEPTVVLQNAAISTFFPHAPKAGSLAVDVITAVRVAKDNKRAFQHLEQDLYLQPTIALLAARQESMPHDVGEPPNFADPVSQMQTASIPSEQSPSTSHVRTTPENASSETASQSRRSSQNGQSSVRSQAPQQPGFEFSGSDIFLSHVTMNNYTGSPAPPVVNVSFNNNGDARYCASDTSPCH